MEPQRKTDGYLARFYTMEHATVLDWKISDVAAGCKLVEQKLSKTVGGVCRP